MRKIDTNEETEIWQIKAEQNDEQNNNYYKMNKVETKETEEIKETI